MPVSHLGLSVSNVTESTDFYLAALRPLGYRYLGRLGDLYGLGVQEADLFLCKPQNGNAPSPTHVAFKASDSETVRDCYTAALKFGAQPNGAPDHRASARKDDGSDAGSGGCYNAAVLDPDGHTIEFIFREGDRGSQTEAERSSPAAPIPPPASSQGSGSVPANARTRSSTASRPSNIPDESAPSAYRSPPPATSNTPMRNGIVNTLIGAAAGAAFAYAVRTDDRGRDSPTAERLASTDRPSARSTAGSVRHSAGDGRFRNGSQRPSASNAPLPIRRQTYDERARSSVNGSQPGIRRTHILPGQVGHGPPPPRHSAASRPPPSQHASAVSMRSGHSRRPSEAGAPRPPPVYAAPSSGSSRPPPSRSTLRDSARSRPPAALSRYSRRHVDTRDDFTALDDLETVVPDDSISCVDPLRPQARESRRSDSNVRRSSVVRGESGHERGRPGTMASLQRPRARSEMHGSRRR